MGAASDDLTRPLGAEPDRREASGRLGRAAVIVAGAVVAAAIVLVVSVRLLGDPRGGVPYARVAIVDRPGPAPSVSADADAPVVSTGTPSANRRGAGEVELSSGVSVVRPAGTAAPDSVIVRVPDASELKPAEPDARLVERTRFGPLPRIGPSGLKPVDLYARPAGDLPDGAVATGRIAIVVGGIGIGQSATASAMAKLPAAVTLALAPYGQDLEGLARRARDDGHEVMLQVPMEPFDYPDSDPGPHTLKAAAKPADNLEHLQWALGRFTGYVGIVNYMGGKLTADERALAPVLKEVAGRGLAFLDDGSSSRSTVPPPSGALRSGRADAVIDAVARPDAIDGALARLEAIAAGGKVAVGTASALPLSVDRIARWAATLPAKGILLVPVTTALRPDARESAVR